MHVVVLYEWDTPKDEETFSKCKEIDKKWIEYWLTISKEKSIKPIYDKIFTDNTGHVSNWTEYENMADFQMIWDDETYQAFWAEFSRYADNCRIRVMRPVTIGVDA